MSNFKLALSKVSILTKLYNVFTLMLLIIIHVEIFQLRLFPIFTKKEKICDITYICYPTTILVGMHNISQGL